jgi:6-pyruvoyltetrahydropterin/6-carboxytetrahydropterin synthase
MFKASRFHDISCGHRVYGHESKCAHFHGHNYRVHFTCEPLHSLDDLGRVVDFSVIKEKLCMWIERNWDHKMLLWANDPAYVEMHKLDPLGVVSVPFNPTAENMAEYLVHIVGPTVLKDTAVRLCKVEIDETPKCTASFERKPIL